MLLKLIIADNCGIDISDMLDRQREHIAELAETITDQLDAGTGTDVVVLWRSESSHAALRFLDRLPRR